MEISFADFRALMKRRQRNVDELVSVFRGRIDESREFLERVMARRWRGEDLGDVVIPYRSVVEFYRRELAFFQDSARKGRVCACGCGLLVFDRKKWAGEACRKRKKRGESVSVDSGFASA
jgi:hypothetical protein